MKGERISFGQLKEVLEIPDLISIQTQSFADFLQKDTPPEERKLQGLQEVLVDTFPPKNSGNTNAFGVEFQHYEVVEQDRDLPSLLKSGGSYQADIYAVFRMKGASSKDIKEERILMCHMPLMTESGSFVINGSERVIVSQLHRSPGICFEVNKHPSGKMIYSFKIIADHGAWLEVQFDIKDMMYIYLDRKRRRRKFLISTLLRAFGCNGNRELLDAVYGVEELSVADLLARENPESYTTADAVVDPHDKKNTLVEALDALDISKLEMLQDCGVKSVPVVCTDKIGDYFINCLRSDTTVTCEDAQKEIFKRMHPSDPVSAVIAKQSFERQFMDEHRYDLGLVGRFKMNQSLGINVDPKVRTLTKYDIAAAIRRLMDLYKNSGKADDIDHLSRRRIRTIGELLQNQCRVGLARVARSARERMKTLHAESGTVSIGRLITTKGFESAVHDFFQHNQLSQFMDQTNCLSELTNKRRISALGPGGLLRERAGAQVRDVHPSHYGRICPIETPEGPNIGLISSLALYAKLDEFGFIMTPYCKVTKGAVKLDRKGRPEIVYMKADEEENHIIAQANAPRNEKGVFINPYVLGRLHGEAGEFPREKVEYIDVSPKQMISAAASVITFLEHNDANRALMGCNMQRQALPLMKPERPLVGTGMEAAIARYSHAIVVAKRNGIVAWADGQHIVVTPNGKLPKDFDVTAQRLNIDDEKLQVYVLYKFLRSNGNTLVNQRPIVRAGQTVTAGQPIADGACTDEGELALGRNVLVAFMPWRGYNFEDAIIISEKLVQDDVYTSVHINLQEVEARDTKQGTTEEITRDIPNVSQEALSNLDTEGVIRIGAVVEAGDVLVGKVTPKNDGDLQPEERLLKAIFGEKASDVKDTSLRADNGNDGVVMDIYENRPQDASKARLSQRDLKSRQDETRLNYRNAKEGIIADLVKELSEVFLGQKLLYSIHAEDPSSHENREIIAPDRKITKQMLTELARAYDTYEMKESPERERIEEIIRTFRPKLRDNDQCCKEAIELLKRNEGADPGVIKSVKVYIAAKRRLSIGDKMAGRHGNKGIVSKIVPIADLPFMADGTPVEIILNPLGVPSRMNIGQIFETHAGWAAKILGINVATPSFDGLPEARMVDLLERARLVKIAQAAGVELSEKITLALREVEGRDVEAAKQELRRLITAAGWTVGPRDDANSTGGKVTDPEGIDRTDDFVDIDGKTRVYDGRTGDPFAQRVMVGRIYMLKLDHLVVNKIHARSNGPYSLITAQPLGGKAQHGGQRFGEMEVWALEAYGAAYTLMEILTVKSDDVSGREKIYNSILRGSNELNCSLPESFNVLLREMMSLCLDVRLQHANSTLA